MINQQRNTKQRSAVATLLGESDSFHSAQTLHAMLRDRGERIGLTTVYRTLQQMAAAGVVDALRTDTGEAVYRRCSDDHHHLVCRSCGATVEVDGPAVERWTARIAMDHGYTDVSHTLDIFGTCPNCAR